MSSALLLDLVKALISIYAVFKLNIVTSTSAFWVHKGTQGYNLKLQRMRLGASSRSNVMDN